MAIKFPKKQEQRLIPKYLLEYAEDLHENHPDPTAEWGGSGVADIEAGTGIEITGETTKTISLDTNPDTFEVTASTGMTLEVENDNPLYKDSKLQMSDAGATRLEGTQISLEANNIYLNSDNAPYYVNNTTHEYKQLATTDQLFSGDYNDLYNKPDLSVYELKSEAFSGDYNDLTNKPSIPTKTSDLTNDSGYITSSDIPTNYVTTDTAQTVTGAKTFRKTVKVQQANSNTRVDVNPNNIWVVDSDNNDNTIISNNGLSTTLNNTQTVQLERTTYQRDNIAKVSPQNFTITQKDTFSDSTYKTYTFDKTKEGIVAVTSDIPTDISAFNNDSGYITGITSSDVITALGYTPGTSNFSGDYDDLTDKPDLSVYELKTDAFSGDYNDLTNKPTIPTVGNGTITIKKNNTTVSTFTTNQSTNKSINITVPTDTSDLTNGAGFITAAQVPAGWEVVDVYQSQGSTPVSAADLAKLAGDNVCIRYNLDAIATDAYELFYKKGSPVLYNGYVFDSFNLNYNLGTSYIGFGQIYVNATTGAWSYTEDNRAYAGHKIEAGSGLVEGIVTSYGRPLSIDTSVVALKTDIPSVGNGTITIQKNGTTVDTFTTNQSSNKSINITVPTAVSDLTNDSGFITGITSSDVTTALGYTPGTSNFTGFEVIAMTENDYTISASDYAKLSVNTIITRSETNTGQVWTYTYLGEDDAYINYGRTIPQYASGTSDGEFRFKYLGIKKTPNPNTTHAISFGYNHYYVQLPTVNDNTITITQGGVTKGSFTLNQNTNQTIEVDNVPGMIGEVIFSTTPTSGVTTYPINLTKNITQYDYIEVYYNVNDDTIQRWCQTFPNPAVGNRFNLTCFGNGTTRLYTKNSCFEIATTTSLALINSAQQRVGNNEATTVGVSTTQFHCRPYKIIGYKQNSAPVITYDNLYRNNDSFAFNSIANLQGYLTSAGKTIQFTVTTPKLLTNVTSITVDNLYAVIRGVGGYVNGSSYIDYANTTGYTVTAYKATDNMITITIDATNAYSSGTNNTPVALAFNPNNNTGLKLTFNE